MPAATAALMLRVEPNCAIDTVSSAPVRAASEMPGPSWPNTSRQSRGSAVVSSGTEPGMLSTATTVSPASAAKASSSSVLSWWRQVLVAVGDHGAATVPAPASDDVHGVDGEGVGGADHRADVGVVAEVLDGDVQRVPAAVDVGDDRLARPVPVGVDDVASVAVAQQLRVVARVVGHRTRPGPDTGGAGRPFGGADVSHGSPTARRRTNQHRSTICGARRIRWSGPSSRSRKHPRASRTAAARITLRGRRTPRSGDHGACSRPVRHRPFWPVNAVSDGLEVLDTTELAGNEGLRLDDEKYMVPGPTIGRTAVTWIIVDLGWQRRVVVQSGLP